MKKQNDLENQTLKLIQDKIKFDSESDIIDNINTLPFYEVFEEELYEICKQDWEDGEVVIEEDPDIEIEVNTYYYCTDEDGEFYDLEINDWPQPK